MKCGLCSQDKYAVFRELEPENDRTFKETERVLHSKSADDFGDFLCADTNISHILPPKDVFASAPNVEMLFPVNGHFANFDTFQQSSMPQINEVLIQDNFGSVEENDFGDFACSNRPACETLTVESFSRGSNQKDNLSLGETQSICSLDLGLYACDATSYTGEYLSRQGSIPSLDLRSSALEDGENGNPDEVTNTSPVPYKNLQQKSPPFAEEDNSSGASSFIKGGFPTTAPLIDKYSFIRHESESIVLEDKLCYEWVKCLRSCNELLQNANHIFEQMSNNQVMTEVLHTEEGQDYVKNVTEVYRVTERIHQSSIAVGRQNEDLHQELASIKQAWVHLTSFLIKTSLMPTKQDWVNFSSTVPRSDLELVACGVCLLQVDSGKHLEQDKLTYGGRQYHSTCANLWVNCVDLLLPALPIPHLL